MHVLTSRTAVAALACAACLLWPAVLLACPTCKDQIAADPAAQNIARGYFYSILFMLSMPPLILTGLGGYFYYEIRKARAEHDRQRLLAAAAAPQG